MGLMRALLISPQQEAEYQRSEIQRLRVDVQRLWQMFNSLRDNPFTGGPNPSSPEDPMADTKTILSGVMSAAVGYGGSGACLIDGYAVSKTVYAPRIPVLASSWVVVFWNKGTERWEILEAPRTYRGSVSSQINKGSTGNFTTAWPGGTLTVNARYGTLKTGKILRAIWQPGDNEWAGVNADC